MLFIIIDLFNYYAISGDNRIKIVESYIDSYYLGNSRKHITTVNNTNMIQYIINELDYCFQIYLNFIDNIYTHILYTLNLSSKQRNIGLIAITKIRDILKYTIILKTKPISPPPIIDPPQTYHETQLQDIIREILPKRLTSLNLRPYIQRIFVKINDTIMDL